MMMIYILGIHEDDKIVYGENGLVISYFYKAFWGILGQNPGEST